MAMVQISESTGGDFLPIVQYDARSGRVFRADKDNGTTTKVDITRTFKAIFDFEGAEVGWINFQPGVAPDFKMGPLGATMPPRPSDQHKQGVRLHVKLSKECGGDVRELAATSAAFLRGINAVHDEYLKLVPANPGRLPVLTLADTVPIESGGAKKTTNYMPIWSIVGWAARPADLGEAPARPAPAASAPTAAAPHRAAPATPLPAAVADDDFG